MGSVTPEGAAVCTVTAMLLPAGSTAPPSSSESFALGRSSATRTDTLSPDADGVGAREYTYGSVRTEAGTVSGAVGYPWNASSEISAMARAAPTPVDCRHIRAW